MNPMLLWTTTFVFGLAMAVGTIWFCFVILGALPVLLLVAASSAQRAGLSGLLLGFGGFYLLFSTWTILGAVLVAAGLIPGGLALLGLASTPAHGPTPQAG